MADADLLAELPAGWQVKRLADLASLQSGGTPSKQRADFWQGSIPWASPKDMKRPYLSDTEDHISEEGLADGSRRVPAGSLFVVVRGMILDRDVPIAMASVPMAFNQDMKAIIPNGQVDGDFLLFVLRQFREQLRKDIGSSAHGTKRISTSAIEGFRLPLPPVTEQRAIAGALRAALRAKEAAEAVVASARQLKRSLLRHLFTYGPVPVEEADRVPLKETEAGPIPEHWEVKPLGGLLREGTGEIQTGPFGGQLHASDYKPSGVPVVNPTHLGLNEIVDQDIPRIDRQDADRLARHYLREGDILISRRGDFSRYAYISNRYVGWLCGTGCMRIRVSHTGLDSRFLGLSFSTDRIQSYLRDHSVGSIMPNLNGKILTALPICLPSQSEQGRGACRR